MVLIGFSLGLAGAPQQSSALRAWPASVAGSASGTYSMMRYVGSISGTALAAAMLGSDPGENHFRALYAILGVFALANLAVIVAGRVRAAGDENSSEIAAELSPSAPPSASATVVR